MFFPRPARFLSLCILMTLAAFRGAGETKLSESAVRKSMRSLAEEVIRPGYGAFRETAADLEKAFARLCEKPDAKKLETARAAFRRTAVAWGGIEAVNFGPATKNYRRERTFYYPDRKFRALKKVKTAIQKKDESYLADGAITKKSAAVQGLGAVEYALFGQDGEAMASGGNAYRCKLGLVISTNLLRMAEKISESWNQSNPLDALPKDKAVKVVIGMMVHGLEIIRDRKIKSFLKTPPAKDRVKSAPLRLSGSTFPFLQAQTRSIRDFYFTPGLTSWLAADQAHLSENFEFYFSEINATFEKLDVPLQEALADEEKRAELIYVIHALDALAEGLNGDFSAAVGVRAGFSSGDGD